jgi:hypothetical protein
MPTDESPTAAAYLSRWDFCEPLWEEHLTYFRQGAKRDELLTVLHQHIVAPIGNEDCNHAMDFLRDACQLSPDSVRFAFRDAVLASPLVPALLALCDRDGSLNRRLNAVYTLAKIGATNALPGLEAVLRRRRDIDPLLLPRLLMEIGWLGGDRDRSAQYVAQSTGYLSRWSLLGNSAMDTDPRILVDLARDPHPLIRADAEHRLAYLRLPEETRGMTGGDRKRAYRRHHADAPVLTFAFLELRFYHAMTWEEYTVAQLDAFVRTQGEEKP